MNTQSRIITDSLNRLLSDVTAERTKPTVYRNLEIRPKAQSKVIGQWWQPGNTGNDLGASDKPHGAYTWFDTVPEVVTVLPKAAFDNFLFIHPLPVPEDLPRNWVISFDNFSVTEDSLGATQALECYAELSDGINRYNGSYQFDQVSKMLRIFNHLKGTWFIPDAAKTIPYPDISKPLTLKGEGWFDRQAQTVTHDVVWINGVSYNIGVTQPATPMASPIELVASFQIDPNSTKPVTVEVANISFAGM